MDNTRDKEKRVLTLSQEKYVEKVLSPFGMFLGKGNDNYSGFTSQVGKLN